MRKQRFKCHGFGFTLDDYKKLRDYGFGNEDIQILALNPNRFFKCFLKYSKHIPESLKNDAYVFCKKALIRKEAMWYGKPI